MQKHFVILIKTRQLILKITEHLSLEQLNKIQQAFKNNIAWNIAHLAVTQQLLCYKLSGLNCLISEEMISNFQKGTAPNQPISKGEFEEIKLQFLQLPLRLEE